MLLEGKNAIVYGGSGSVGSAVARAFAREGTRVFLAGRTLAPLEEVAEKIIASGGVAETAQVDPLPNHPRRPHSAAVRVGWLRDGDLSRVSARAACAIDAAEHSLFIQATRR
jgi:NAD(P)-dependent dehydrogenase (short-subunit alcohol dehydrogenase family)